MSEEYPVTDFEFPEKSEGFREIERLYAGDKKVVAVVGAREGGAFTYALYAWDLTDAEYVGGGYWSCCGIGGMYLEYSAAKSEAKQELSCHS